MQSQLRTASCRWPNASVRHGRAGQLHRTASTTVMAFPGAGARRRRDWDFKPNDQVEQVVEEATATSQGFFNENFKAVLSSTLERQGASSLLQGQEKMVDEHNLSDQEDVLKAAIMASKSTLMKLNLVKKEVDQAIEIETKQVERLMFALNKARNDAAYYRSLSQMIDDGAASD